MASDSLPAFSPAQPGRVLSVALYARVSTINHGQDTELQLKELRELASRRGFVIAQEFRPGWAILTLKARCDT
jgi:hypothetical protein